MSSIYDHATWEPLLRLMVAGNAEELAAPGGYVTGHIGRGSWSAPVPRPAPHPGRASQIEDWPDEWDAITRVSAALTGSDLNNIPFVLQRTAGRVILHLFALGPAVEFGLGPYPGSLLLVEDALPEPWRRQPEPVPDAAPAASADPALLERTLRERLPDAIGATEEEITAAEARLGIALPDELKAMYRVTRALWEDWDGHDSAQRHAAAVKCELFSLDELYIADVAARPRLWEFAASEAVFTTPDSAVQGLVGSPGWIVFGDNGGGDRLAVDLTPGPRGNLGQIIILSHEENIGATLIAESLTDLLVNERRTGSGRPHTERAPLVARVNIGGVPSVEAAADPRLEVLSIGVWDRAPVSLSPVFGLPRLRTLSAYPRVLADPLEIAELPGLEFLQLGPEDWRVLLDASAVPWGLSAALIQVHGQRNPLEISDLANEILALWRRPQITRTIIEGPAPHIG